MRGRGTSGRFISIPGASRAQTRQPEWRAYVSMLQRCENPNHRSFHRYGGRGIAVCPAWRNSFDLFLGDVGRRPSYAHSLDRIDNDGNYEPGNIRWATRREQARNSSIVRPLSFRGETLLVTDWADRLGVKVHTITTRLARGWSLDRTLTHGASGRKPVPVESAR